MTDEEMLAREAIRQTMARYTTAGDRLQIEEFVATFTEDAIMESEQVEESDSFRYSGRDEIRGWMQRWLDRAASPAAGDAGAKFVRHHLSTCDIRFTGQGQARARTYWTAYTDIGPDHCGYYLDDFQRVGDQWLLSHRRVRLDWRSPQSRFFNVA